MQIIAHPQEPLRGNDWEGTLGAGRDELIETLLGEGWLEKYGRRLDIYEDRGFELYFTVRDNPELKNEYEQGFRFSAIFNYEGAKDTLRLMDVSADRHLGKRGGGRDLPFHALRALVHAGGRRLEVHPDLMGSYVWLRAGAVPQTWPESWLLQDRFQEVLGRAEIRGHGWQKADLTWLRRLYEAKEPLGLCEIAASNDLLVKSEEGAWEKLGVYLLKDITLGPAFFDLAYPWTTRRLHNYVGFDAAQARADGRRPGMKEVLRSVFELRM